jgi:hypothetical protein
MGLALAGVTACGGSGTPRSAAGEHPRDRRDLGLGVDRAGRAARRSARRDDAWR